MGGLLGLFVGISMCTGFEVLELIIDLIIVTCKRGGSKTTPVHVVDDKPALPKEEDATPGDATPVKQFTKEDEIEVPTDEALYGLSKV